jgi:hypothetical protein
MNHKREGWATRKIKRAGSGDLKGLATPQQLGLVEENVQALLKQEWEKSKEEARTGRLVSKVSTYIP